MRPGADEDFGGAALDHGLSLHRLSAHERQRLFPDHGDSNGLAITEGETVIGGLHGAAEHNFCGHCMSWMFTRPQGLDWFVNVRPTLLDEQQGFTPFIETYTSEKLPWAITPARHSFEQVPAMEAYEGLIKAYGAQG